MKLADDYEEEEDAVPLMQADDDLDDAVRARHQHQHHHASGSSSASTLVSSGSSSRLGEDEDDGVGHVPYAAYKHGPTAGGQRNDEYNASSRLRKRTPLPLFQLFILCLTRLSEPIAYTQIFPVSNVYAAFVAS